MQVAGSTKSGDVVIECLGCGVARVVTGTLHLDTGECANCGYQGWAFPEAIGEETLSRRRSPKVRLEGRPSRKGLMGARWL
jgi:hypothetical protein